MGRQLLSLNPNDAVAKLALDGPCIRRDVVEGLKFIVKTFVYIQKPGGSVSLMRVILWLRSRLCVWQDGYIHADEMRPRIRGLHLRSRLENRLLSPRSPFQNLSIANGLSIHALTLILRYLVTSLA